ncbi:MAG: Holliday junction resolvase RuvX [Gemmataceae bacterium]
MSNRTRILGIDFGTVRIGLAVSDPDRKIAFPLATYERANKDRDAAYFRKIIEDEQIGQLVIGLPIHLDGRESPKSVEARQFGQWLQETTRLPVSFYDERFTSIEAEATLWSAGLTHKKRKDRRDRVAAQMILQAYLEAGCPAIELPVARETDRNLEK